MQSLIELHVRRSNTKLVFSNLGLLVLVLFLWSNNASFIVLVFLISGFALASWNILRSVRRYFNPTLHPIYESLQRYGDPGQVGASIDNEFRSPSGYLQLPKCLLSARWLVYPTVFSADFIHLDYVLWIFKQRTKHYTNFIPTGTTYSAIIVTRFGQLDINASEAGVYSILESLRQRIPWVLTGYSDELKRIWDSTPNDLIASVDNRRQMFHQQFGGSTGG